MHLCMQIWLTNTTRDLLFDRNVRRYESAVAPTSKPYSAGVIIIVHVATDQVAWTASDRS